MEQIIRQQGNTVIIENKDTGEILATIGIQFFSIEFYETTIQIVDSSKVNDVYTIQLADLYDEALNPLNTQALALASITNFLPPGGGGGGGVNTVTGQAVDNTDPANPIVNSNFGLYSQILPSNLINTVGEQSIIGTGVGGLIIPANVFKIGDSFHGKLGGLLNATGGGGRSEITIKIKAGTVILASTGPFDLDEATNQGWELELDFTIANIGLTGQICTNGNFVYTKDNNRTVFGYIFQDVQPVDTTINNTLDITIEWNVLNTNDSIYSANFVLYKTF